MEKPQGTKRYRNEREQGGGKYAHDRAVASCHYIIHVTSLFG
jgi:hypothetical protein